MSVVSLSINIYTTVRTVPGKLLLPAILSDFISELIRLPDSYRFSGQNSRLPVVTVYGQILPVAFGCPWVCVMRLWGGGSFVSPVWSSGAVAASGFRGRSGGGQERLEAF
jgi:hypothetical protein